MILIDTRTTRRRFTRVAMALATAALGHGAQPGTLLARRRRRCQRLIIPAYAYPAGEGIDLWNRAIDRASAVGYLIVNPASGPGTTADRNYMDVIARARKAKIPLLGYVATTYGGRDADAVKDDVDRYAALYGIHGIFFDESSSQAIDVPYYLDLAEYVRRQQGAPTVLNHGVVPDRGYLKAGDVLVTFEQTAEAYETASFPAWTRKLSARRFAHLVHTAPGRSSMRVAMNRAKRRNARYVYVTDDVLNNPWDRLPPYFEAEATLARADCRR